MSIRLTKQARKLALDEERSFISVDAYTGVAAENL